MIKFNTVVLLLFLHTPVYGVDLEDLSVTLKLGNRWYSNGSSFSDGSPLYGINIGGPILGNLGWDIGYQKHQNVVLNLIEQEKATVDMQFHEAAFRYDFPMNDFSVYGRGGIAYWNSSTQSNIGQKIQESGLSPLFEISVSRSLTERVSVSSGYQFISGVADSHLGSFDSHALFIGLTYSFGSSSVNVDSLQETQKDATEHVIKEYSDSTNIMFSHNSSDLNMDQKAYLESLRLENLDIQKIELIGHSDSTGSAAYNQILAEDRAQSVERHLRERFGDKVSIHSHGKGESEPIDSNFTEEGRAQNRRVTLTWFATM